jgi:hypothetical protein
MDSSQLQDQDHGTRPFPGGGARRYAQADHLFRSPYLSHYRSKPPEREGRFPDYPFRPTLEPVVRTATLFSKRPRPSRWFMRYNGLNLSCRMEQLTTELFSLLPEPVALAYCIIPRPFGVRKSNVYCLFGGQNVLTERIRRVSDMIGASPKSPISSEENIEVFKCERVLIE